MKKQVVLNADRLYVDENADSFILVEPYIDQTIIRDIMKGRLEFLQYPFFDETVFRNANRYIVDLTERMISAYGLRFNKQFRTNLNTRQWTTILCIWLKTTLFDLYYKYNKIKQLTPNDVYTIAPASYPMENRTAQYIRNGLCSQEKNAYIWGYLCEKMGIKVIHRDNVNFSSCSNSFIDHVKRAKSNPQKIYNLIKYRLTGNYRVIENISSNVSVALFDTLLPEDIRERIIKKSDGKIGYLKPSAFHSESARIISKYKKNIHERYTLLHSAFEPGNEFEHIASAFVIENIPVPYVEGFSELYKRAEEITSEWNVERIYTVCACAELMDICNAIAISQGAKICEIQHSIAYGAYDTYTIEECMYADEFLTWGWSKEQFPYLSAKIRPLAITRFPNKIVSNPPRELRIVMTCNFAIKSEEGHGWYFGNYVEKQMDFIDNLSDKLRRSIILRIDSHDPVNMELVYRARKKYPYIKYEDRYEIPFYKSVNNCNFIICDYYSSTHVESILMGRPFVMFNASEIIAMNPFIKGKLELLRSYGLYADTGKEMADILNTQPNITDWLYSKEIDEIYHRYLKDCIGTDKSIINGASQEIENIWFSEFMR